MHHSARYRLFVKTQKIKIAEAVWKVYVSPSIQTACKVCHWTDCLLFSDHFCVPVHSPFFRFFHRGSHMVILKVTFCKATLTQLTARSFTRFFF